MTEAIIEFPQPPIDPKRKEGEACEVLPMNLVECINPGNEQSGKESSRYDLSAGNLAPDQIVRAGELTDRFSYDERLRAVRDFVWNYMNNAVGNGEGFDDAFRKSETLLGEAARRLREIDSDSPS